MKISQNGIDFIKSHEGFRAVAYDDLNPNATLNNDSIIQGVLTIGYGHTHNVKVGDYVTEDEAEQLLKEDLFFAESAVKDYVQVEITQNMYDALVSLFFNVGIHNIATKQYPNNNFVGSTLLHKLNQSDYLGASNRFPDFVKAGGQVLQGLVTRRNEEKDLFLKDMSVLNYQLPTFGSMTDGINLDNVYLSNKKKSNVAIIILILLALFFITR
ncbi:lysozyme [Mesoflavibacter sp. SCSIO 43206]|uniref:lysozyme n=1 Tax=Mesoflavibacter sp. SCSIO 43206 TaxID=2779362 RepID=UPI001CA88F4B|nr:lysozyme [Mesoflavibacter sp. SCSIO 43206]UAB75143.1 lysozyme [Mesoflavibacter sp. SCSIO 43206]